MICQFPLAASFSPIPHDQCALCSLTFLLLICSFSCEVYFLFLIPWSFPVYWFFCPLAIDSFKHILSLAKIQLKGALPQKKNCLEKLSFHNDSGWHLPSTLLSIFFPIIGWKRQVNTNSPWMHNEPMPQNTVGRRITFAANNMQINTFCYPSTDTIGFSITEGWGNADYFLRSVICELMKVSSFLFSKALRERADFV